MNIYKSCQSLKKKKWRYQCHFRKWNLWDQYSFCAFYSSEKVILNLKSELYKHIWIYLFKFCACAQRIRNWYLVILNLKYWSLRYNFGNLSMEYEHLDWQITLRLDWLGYLVFTNRKCFVNSLPPHCLQSIHTDSNKW